MARQVRGTCWGQKGLVRGLKWLVPDVGRANWTGLMSDKHLRLVMTPIALNCTRQSRAPNIDRCVPENWPLPLTLTRDLDIWPWPRPLTFTLKQGNSDVKTRFLAFDLELWPTTLTYNPKIIFYNMNMTQEPKLVPIFCYFWCIFILFLFIYFYFFFVVFF